MRMFEGKSIIVMDQWGRVRIPAGFLRIFEETCGRDVFVTSIDGESVTVFPMSEWEGIASRINRMSGDDRTLKNIMRKMNLNGLIASIDKKGGISIHKDLRRKTKLKGRIAIKGGENHLILKNANWRVGETRGGRNLGTSLAKITIRSGMEMDNNIMRLGKSGRIKLPKTFLRAVGCPQITMEGFYGTEKY